MGWFKAQREKHDAFKAALKRHGLSTWQATGLQQEAKKFGLKLSLTAEGVDALAEFAKNKDAIVAKLDQSASTNSTMDNPKTAKLMAAVEASTERALTTARSLAPPRSAKEETKVLTVDSTLVNAELVVRQHFGWELFSTAPRVTQTGITAGTIGASGLWAKELGFGVSAAHTSGEINSLQQTDITLKRPITPKTAALRELEAKWDGIMAFFASKEYPKLLMKNWMVDEQEFIVQHGGLVRKKLREIESSASTLLAIRRDRENRGRKSVRSRGPGSKLRR